MAAELKWRAAIVEGLWIAFALFLATLPFLLAIPYELRHGQLFRMPTQDFAFDAFQNFVSFGASAIAVLLPAAYGFFRRRQPVLQTAVAFVIGYGGFALMRLRAVDFGGFGTQPYFEPILLAAVLGLIALGQWLEGQETQTSPSRRKRR